jgi:hypothetical protein
MCRSGFSSALEAWLYAPVFPVPAYTLYWPAYRALTQSASAMSRLLSGTSAGTPVDLLMLVAPTMSAICSAGSSRPANAGTPTAGGAVDVGALDDVELPRSWAVTINVAAIATPTADKTAAKAHHCQRRLTPDRGESHCGCGIRVVDVSGPRGISVVTSPPIGILVVVPKPASESPLAPDRRVE